jgi:hypothetical protein
MRSRRSMEKYGEVEVGEVWRSMEKYGELALLKQIAQKGYYCM